MSDQPFKKRNAIFFETMQEASRLLDILSAETNCKDRTNIQLNQKYNPSTVAVHLSARPPATHKPLEHASRIKSMQQKTANQPDTQRFCDHFLLETQLRARILRTSKTLNDKSPFKEMETRAPALRLETG